MMIKDLCSRDVKSCALDSSLAEAAAVMEEHNIGGVAVLDAKGRLAGVVTDRDICAALAARKERAHVLPVGKVMSGDATACTLEDTVGDALRKMRKAGVRRLPVVDDKDRLQGFVTVNDLIHGAEGARTQTARKALFQEIMLTLMAISQKRRERGLRLAEVRSLA